jgi:hypothetical protein
VRNRPAEIDFGLDDLAVAHRQNLGVAEGLARCAPPFIGDEDPISVANQVDESETGDRLTGLPASIEIGLAIDAIVERAGEMKIVVDDRFDRPAVLRAVSFKPCERLK